MRMPASWFISSPARCGVLPLPEPAKPIWSGLARASAMSSCTLFTGSEAFTMSTFGPKAIIATGAKSRIGS